MAGACSVLGNPHRAHSRPTGVASARWAARHGLSCAIWRDRALPTLLQSFNTNRFTAPQPRQRARGDQPGPGEVGTPGKG